ncbi:MULTISPECIES: hypothetical protein [Streptomycetaceae]|uniref:Uncharacterized protein n=1 Tax=Streptantibioticus cattleyicolor (strain ATCC 35852 / DSM 46488 / JCM 4925 / NBRC 14057 / NRRL 8057) TaxID=1003195 RepID=F8JWV4_STREN|nr:MULTISPECIES: hypothetical protein [Streptomycetaceae]AEW92992.1 hypothetical protein SCATT_06210 [Streptantibioticus cattleyicolor NRRL 8057 = DSM 46488]MYS57731.1 hypothetical protein [Streptomyces sp. SID5468]CCB73351.1 protein of unknown function [Streptantibioticus cattleyicolor NRRL 8057 = DSM 46488]
MTNPIPEFFQPGRTYLDIGGGYRAPELSVLFYVEHVTRHPARGHLRAVGWAKHPVSESRWFGHFQDEEQYDTTTWYDVTDSVSFPEFADRACYTPGEVRNALERAEERDRYRTAWYSARARGSKRTSHEREILLFRLLRDNRELRAFATLAHQAADVIAAARDAAWAELDRAKRLMDSDPIVAPCPVCAAPSGDSCTEAGRQVDTHLMRIPAHHRAIRAVLDAEIPAAQPVPAPPEAPPCAAEFGGLGYTRCTVRGPHDEHQAPPGTLRGVTWRSGDIDSARVYQTEDPQEHHGDHPDQY